MAYNNNREGFKLNEENIASFLKDAVNRVEKASNAEIETLKQIKKLFKKNVPFSRRSYVAALLIKNANSGFKSNRFSRTEKTEKFGRSDRNERFSRNESRQSERNSEERKERTEKSPRVTIDPSVADTIFISVGRSRGVFPRDLVGLLVSVAGLERSRIGEIRVLYQILINHGIPAMFYTDRRTVFEYKRKDKPSDAEDTFTQFSYACHNLGIKIKTTSVPQAKGRVERLNQTLQSRLPVELRHAHITNIEEANVFLNSYIKKYNNQFALRLNSTKSD